MVFASIYEFAFSVLILSICVGTFSIFSKFGPVQDVRIPCQQKRMFGFVTFAFAETVKQILTKGNPHFVCGARVLVKPYREKSRLVDRYKFGAILSGKRFICFVFYIDNSVGFYIYLSSSFATQHPRLGFFVWYH